MPASFCKFVFPAGVSRRFVEDTVAAASLLAEYVFSRSRAGIDAAWSVAGDPARCLIDISTPAGRYVAVTVFEILISLRGERSFEIFKVDGWKL